MNTERPGTRDLAQALGRSIADDPLQAAAVIAALAVAASMHPLAGIASLLAGGSLLAYRLRDRPDALGRTKKDRAAMSGRFSLHLGRDKETRKPVLLDEDDTRQHMLVFGDTGSSKTEILLGMAEGVIAGGSGTMIVNGGGDVSVYARVFALAALHGREDDILVLNMMFGNANVGGDGAHLVSNTMNPFSTGSSDNLTQLIVSMMDDADGSDGAMWKGRATAMFTGLMRYLTWRRENGDQLDVGVIRDHLGLKMLVGIAEGTHDPDVPAEIKQTLASYLTSLPGFNLERGARQAQTTLDQHGYLEMQFTKVLGSLADVYGHIFKVPYGEIDMRDVVLNRRILVVMLPSLEHSGAELANLCKIAVATLKGMMGGALGNRIEGSWAEIVDNRVMNSPSPFLCILDDVGHYAVEGLALMAAQARSLGFSMVYAAQDIPAMKRLSEKEAASIIANTNTKIFMRTNDCGSSGLPWWSLRGGMGPTGSIDLSKLGVGEMVILNRSHRIMAEGRMPSMAPAAGCGRRIALRAAYLVGLALPGSARTTKGEA